MSHLTEYIDILTEIAYCNNNLTIGDDILNINFKINQVNDVEKALTINMVALYQFDNIDVIKSYIEGISNISGIDLLYRLDIKNVAIEYNFCEILDTILHNISILFKDNQLKITYEVYNLYMDYEIAENILYQIIMHYIQYKQYKQPNYSMTKLLLYVQPLLIEQIGIVDISTICLEYLIG